MPPEPAAAAGPATAPQARQLQAAAAGLGLMLDDALAGRLLAYLQLLQRWNKVYNLTALREPGQMFSHHLLDCLAVVPALRRWADGMNTGSGNLEVRQPLRILDVGSGGGLPGAVLAALEPAWQVACVDTVAKKASFIKQVAAELQLGNLQGLHARVENLDNPAAPADRGSGYSGYDLITSRAFSSLADFTRLSSHLLAPDGVWMAMKGRVPDDEISQLRGNLEVFHVEQLQVPGLDAQRCLVWIRPQQVA